MKIKSNRSNSNLWCCFCKNKIQIGEAYVINEEEIYNDQIINKEYHVDCFADCNPEDEDINDIYISPEN